MISYEFKQYINEKALEYLPMQKLKVGNKYNFRCPFCGDSKKSATKKRGWWYNDTCSFHCFNCGTNLSGIKFLEAVSGSKYAQIKDEYLRLYLKSGLNTSLSSFVDTKVEEPKLFDIKSMLKPEWKCPLSDKAKEYLSNRKVLEAPFLEDTLYSWYSKKNEEYILIPWNLNGCEGAYFQLNDFLKHREMKYIFPKDSKKLVFGLDNIDVSWPYIICFEGVYDSLFVKNGIATGTKSISEYQYKLISERYPHHTIVASFDNDKPGLCSYIKCIKQNRKLKYFKWFNTNTKQKDINDYVLAKGDVNIFTDTKKLERLIVDDLLMKLYLVENGLWNLKETINDKATQRK